MGTKGLWRYRRGLEQVKWGNRIDAFGVEVLVSS